MDPNGKQSRKTNIIDDPVALEYSLAQQNGKSKGRGRASAEATAGPSALALRNAGISKSKAPNKTRAAGQQYYERYGLKIPLHEKGGKQRPHARASTTFRNKNIGVALDIVERYAGSGKRHKFSNENKSKVFIGNWIEMAETLAFGVNPSTKLTGADWAASEFTPPDQCTQSQASGSVPNKKNISKQMPVDEDGLEEAINDIYSSLRNKRKRALDEDSAQNHHIKQQKRDDLANSQPLYKIPANKASTSKLDIDKRTSENAYIPTPPALTKGAVRQEVQNQKSAERQARVERNMESYTLTVSHERKRSGDRTKHVFSAQDSAELVSPTNANTRIQAPALPESSEPTPTIGGYKGSRTPAEEQERLRIFVHATGLDPSRAETATTVMPGPSKNERQVITVTESARGQLALHSTVINRSNFDGPRNSRPIFKPYLKNGRHGPGGQFDNDPDRATGKGHDYEPEDAWNFCTYMEIKSKAGQRRPDGKLVFPQAVQDLRDLGPWYMEYVKQYPGKRLDQWPCGCMKVIEEDRNESEEE